MVGMSGLTRGILRITIRILIIALFVVLAIVVPSFDRIMTLMGSICCFSICIVLPLAFHVKLFGKELSRTEYWGNWVVMAISTVLAIISTVFACLPKDLLGA